MLVIEKVLTKFKRFHLEVKREVLRENQLSEINVIKGCRIQGKDKFKTSFFWLLSVSRVIWNNNKGKENSSCFKQCLVEGFVKLQYGVH